jgi:hypothetical protein
MPKEYGLTYLDENNGWVIEIIEADTDKKAITQAKRLLSGKKYADPGLYELHEAVKEIERQQKARENECLEHIQNPFPSSNLP